MCECACVCVCVFVVCVRLCVCVCVGINVCNCLCDHEMLEVMEIHFFSSDKRPNMCYQGRLKWNVNPLNIRN